MFRRIGGVGLTLLIFLAALFSPVMVRAVSRPVSRRRALLIGCDHFLSQEDTWPAADNNVHLLADTLQNDVRGYSLIRVTSGLIADTAAFRAAVRDAFTGAGENDVSLLYISTHGLFQEGAANADAALLLSDGQREEALDARTLQSILDSIPGVKVLILDFCNSGAFIGKGLSGGAAQILFSGSDYKVLCSAGGSEASWYWQGADQDAFTSGASYFANVLADGLGSQGDFAADSNLDGLITLAELYAFLLDNYAVSTPQAYPQRDDEFVLYAYDPSVLHAVSKAITDITLDTPLLTAGESQVNLSFTVRRRTTLYYQIVYYQDGAWQFSTAQQFRDNEQADGTTLPGRKLRILTLNTATADQYGYAMIQFITLDEGQPRLEGARLLCVTPAEGAANLSIVTGPLFIPAQGQELCILLQHDVPCGLTACIRSMEGEMVTRLCYAAASRPQQLSPAANTFYWDGRAADGEIAPPGQYYAEASTTLGGVRFSCQSAPFTLESPGLIPYTPGI